MWRIRVLKTLNFSGLGRPDTRLAVSAQGDGHQGFAVANSLSPNPPIAADPTCLLPRTIHLAREAA